MDLVERAVVIAHDTRQAFDMLPSSSTSWSKESLHFVLSVMVDIGCLLLGLVLVNKPIYGEYPDYPPQAAICQVNNKRLQ